MLWALFLGVLQGLTEFLPVSSSGHLVLFQQFADIGEDEILFDLVLHVGTLVPVIWFYRREVWAILRDPLFGQGPLLERPGTRWILMVGLATLPTGLMGVLFEDLFETLFSTPAVLVLTFALTGTLLFLTRHRQSGAVELPQLTWKQALILGVAQGFAITPGISRSGSTISVALMMGLEREFAARISFLMSVPAILGAVVLKLRDVDPAHVHADQLVVGGLAALISGYAALVLLVWLVKGGKLSRFAYYCWFAAVAAGGIALYTHLAA